MSFKTPRGRQIDVPIHEAFSLMARLWKRDRSKDAHYVLRTCEAVDNIPEVIGYTAGFCVLFLTNWEPWSIAVAMSAGSLLGITLLVSWAYFLIPASVPLLRLYNRIPELIRALLPMGAVIWSAGWMGLLFWILGLSGGALLNMLIITVAGRWTYRRTNRVLGRAERCFVQAWQICARQGGLIQPDEPTAPAADNEDSLAWRECWRAYLERNPDAGSLG